MDNTNDILANKLFPEVELTPEFFLDKYPQRELSEGARVTRFSPSPTGFVHIGGLFTALVSERVAHQSGGVFFLRIEDTDKKREVENGVVGLIDALKKFGLKIDEGVSEDLSDFGNYGPYTQSKRKDIYHVFVKHLIKEGRAYPCFCSPEELEEIRNQQEAEKIRPGYYGKWAKHRNLSLEEIEKFISEGKEFVIRFRSNGNENNKKEFRDLIKGKVSVTENDTDVPILKSDKLPTYHFAHVVDDYLMRTTDVIRGDEWLSSLPIHLEIFDAFGWKAPAFGHLSPILKLDNGNKRKLSKRKDPESAVEYFSAGGYPVQAITEYLLNIANSDFEDWRKENPELDNQEFKISLDKLSKSGALFSFDKLDNISKTIISRMTAEEVYENSVTWAKNYNPELMDKLIADKDYYIEIFNIERDINNLRKDIGKWSDVEPNTEYFFKEYFEKNLSFDELLNGGKITKELIKSILEAYLEAHNTNVSKEEWFAELKNMADKIGFASDMKEYKANPEKYNGNIADVAGVLRVALTTKTKSPDLYQVMKVLKDDVVLDRLKYARGII